MTICIAARCDKSQNCVVAADRELTVGVPMNIAFEHHERKIESVSKACLVLSSRNALIAEATKGTYRRIVYGVIGFGEVESGRVTLQGDHVVPPDPIDAELAELVRAHERNADLPLGSDSVLLASGAPGSPTSSWRGPPPRSR